MEAYFARAPIINYIGAGLWIAAPIVIVLLVLGVIFTKLKVGLIIVGVLLLIAAFPAAVMLELSINGCCGAPSTGNTGVGFVIGAIVAVAGIWMIVHGVKRLKKKAVK